jgi:hypothetical protein
MVGGVGGGFLCRSDKAFVQPARRNRRLWDSCLTSNYGSAGSAFAGWARSGARPAPLPRRSRGGRIFRGTPFCPGSPGLIPRSLRMRPRTPEHMYGTPERMCGNQSHCNQWRTPLGQRGDHFGLRAIHRGMGPARGIHNGGAATRFSLPRTAEGKILSSRARERAPSGSRFEPPNSRVILGSSLGCGSAPWRGQGGALIGIARRTSKASREAMARSGRTPWVAGATAGRRILTGACEPRGEEWCILTHLARGASRPWRWDTAS